MMPGHDLHRVIADRLSEFQHRLDHAIPLDDLLAPDATVTGPSGSVTGREAVSRFFVTRNREADRAVRHLWFNLRLEPDGLAAVTARYIAAAFHGDPLRPDTLASASLGDATDRFTRAADGAWTLARSEYRAVFRTPATQPRHNGEQHGDRHHP